MGWSIHESVIVISSVPDAGKISHEVVGLLHHLEGGQEAIGGSGGIALRILLEGNDPAIE